MADEIHRVEGPLLGQALERRVRALGAAADAVEASPDLRAHDAAAEPVLEMVLEGEQHATPTRPAMQQNHHVALAEGPLGGGRRRKPPRLLLGRGEASRAAARAPRDPRDAREALGHPQWGAMPRPVATGTDRAFPDELEGTMRSERRRSPILA